MSSSDRTLSFVSLFIELRFGFRLGQVEYTERDYEFAGLQRFGRVSLLALAAASLCYSTPGPAFAFRVSESPKPDSKALTNHQLPGHDMMLIRI